MLSLVLSQGMSRQTLARSTLSLLSRAQIPCPWWMSKQTWPKISFRLSKRLIHYLPSLQSILVGLLIVRQRSVPRAVVHRLQPAQRIQDGIYRSQGRPRADTQDRIRQDWAGVLPCSRHWALSGRCSSDHRGSLPANSRNRV